MQVARFDIGFFGRFWPKGRLSSFLLPEPIQGPKKTPDAEAWYVEPPICHPSKNVQSSFPQENCDCFLGGLRCRLLVIQVAEEEEHIGSARLRDFAL